MVVRGVRRSWDTARRRLARIFSRSESALSFSAFLILVVRAQVMMATTSMTTAEKKFTGMVKLN